MRGAWGAWRGAPDARPGSADTIETRSAKARDAGVETWGANVRRDTEILCTVHVRPRSVRRGDPGGNRDRP